MEKIILPWLKFDMQWGFRVGRRFTDGYNQACAEIIELLGRDDNHAADFYHFGMYKSRLEIANQNLAWIGVEVDGHRDGMYSRQEGMARKKGELRYRQLRLQSLRSLQKGRISVTWKIALPLVGEMPGLPHYL